MLVPSVFYPIFQAKENYFGFFPLFLVILVRVVVTLAPLISCIRGGVLRKEEKSFPTVILF